MDASGLRQKVNFEDLQSISYKKAWDYQTEKLEELKQLKKTSPFSSDPVGKHFLLFCEHNPVYTLGKSGKIDHLLIEEQHKDFEFFKINRGGDITYHGPGQITAYPILDLDYFYHDLHKYVRNLEEVIIRTLEYYDVKGERIEEYTGVWIKEDSKSDRKICAIGVHMSRWVSMHGFAFNVNTQLEHFKNIVPCGIRQSTKEVTSLSKEVGYKLDMDEVKSVVKAKFSEVFKCDLI